MKILYYDCSSGISGDMNLSALLDLGIDKTYLECELKKIDLIGYQLNVEKTKRKSITGTKLQVIITKKQKHHRLYKDIKEIIQQSGIDNKAKEISLKIFEVIANAEAKVHGTTPDNVHFHEVGAIDSIVDIVGAGICIAYLNPDQIIFSPPELGSGLIECAHGTLPVPAPATTEILKDIPVKMGNCVFESTTPTGAAIIAALADKVTTTFDFMYNKVGYGIGHKEDPKMLNILRVFLGEQKTNMDIDTEPAMLLECNIDDMNPEHYEYAMEQLLEHGALDVFITPIIMKKSRPGNLLSVICSSNLSDNMKKIIFTNTSSIGIRETDIIKNNLKREIKKINTQLGEISVKFTFLDGEILHKKPEYNECKALAKQHNLTIKEVSEIINKEL